MTITMYNTWDEWVVGLDNPTNITDYPGDQYDTFDAYTPLDVGESETLSFDTDLTIFQVGSGWLTWSNDYDGEVLAPPTFSPPYEVTATFADGGILSFFCLEIEPNNFGAHEFTIYINEIEVDSKIEGQSGAVFFGWKNTEPVYTFKIQAAESSGGFAFCLRGGLGIPVTISSQPQVWMIP